MDGLRLDGLSRSRVKSEDALGELWFSSVMILGVVALRWLQLPQIRVAQTIRSVEVVRDLSR